MADEHPQDPPAKPQPELDGGSSSSDTLFTLLAVGSLLVLAALVARMALLRPSGLAGTQGPNHELAGQPLPDVLFEPLTNADQPANSSRLDGQVTLINFWGTWCPPCKMELPELVTVRKELASEPRFQMWLVSVGEEEVSELRESTADYIGKQGWPELPNYHDPEARTQLRINEQTGLPMDFPTTIVVDQRRVIRGVWQGYFEGAVEQMEELVRELLSEDPS